VWDDDQTKSAVHEDRQVTSSAENADLLRENDPTPVTILRGHSSAPFVLVADHAGRAIPSGLGDLGLSEQDRQRHIAWDIGVAGLGRHLGDRLEAPLVAQHYSRLVIDCNRRPGHPTSIAPRSDSTDVPGNQGLSGRDRALREKEIFAPYHRSIADLLDRRRAAGQATVLVALHSFTPQLKSGDRPDFGPHSGERPWHAGVLYNHDPRFSLILRDLLRGEGGLVVGDNEPYALSDLDDYTVPVHAEQQGLPHVEIEIRQDLIADAAGEASWAALLARLLVQAWDRYRVAFP
jgi:predicted N-formylglutamate amidohydrolase